MFGDPLARESNHRSENLAGTDTTDRRDKDGMNGRPAHPSACALTRMRTSDTSRTLTYTEGKGKGNGNAVHRREYSSTHS